MRLILQLLILLACLCPQAKAETDETSTREFHHIDAPEISDYDYGWNFGLVYVAQWTFYLVSQNDTIRDNGSWHNWLTNFWSPHFDNDSFDYNIYRHSFTGNYYYLFYRSRGYTEKGAFLWAVASSLAFEMTIETVTERPSYQDIYQTPVFGTILGMGAERASAYLLTRHNWPARVLGHILNPFTLLPGTAYEIRAMPIVGKETLGASISLRF